MFSVARTTRGDDGEARSAMGTTRAAREGTSTWSALDDDGFWEARDQNDDPNGTFGGPVSYTHLTLPTILRV